jgi:hypothetical protein
MPQIPEMPATDIGFVNFNEQEEATCMASITLIRHSKVKAYLVTPILSVLSLFILPLKMYWDNDLNARMTFNTVTDIKRATHVKVIGRGGNVDICKLEDFTNKISQLLNR